MLDYVSYPGFSCRIRAERDLQRLEKLTGSQRYVGLIFPNDAMRQVFIGTLVLGDETRAMQYGEDPDRDIAGLCRAHWRQPLAPDHAQAPIRIAVRRDGTGASLG